jgi:uncharacterized protein YcfJ
VVEIRCVIPNTGSIKCTEDGAMNKSFVIGSVIGGIIVTAGGAFAGYRAISSSHEAKVVSVKALTKTIKTPRQDCHDEQVTHTKPVKDEHRLVGTGVGAALGGLLGSQFGGGNGKILTTVAGVAAGGYAGNKVQQKVQQGNTYTATEQRCATVYDSSEVPAGYEVVYVLNGNQHHIHMDHDPGPRLPVKDGQIVTENSAPAAAARAQSG